MKLGLLGGGSIAATVAGAVAAGRLPGVEIVGVVGSGGPPSEAVRRTAATAGSDVVDRAGLLARAPDWVLEAAGGGAVREHLLALLDGGANVVVMSIGALLDPSLEEAVREREGRGRRVLRPSGAIGGLDAVAALHALGGLERVEITTTKAPKGLAGAPYLEERRLTLPPDRRTVVFEGSAREAVAGFPANVNVAAALSLAGLGADATRVRIVADPSASRTRHAIVAEGSAGRVSIDIEAKPNPANPRSSYLAALSAVATIRGLS